VVYEQDIGVNYLGWCIKKPNKLAGRTHEEWLMEYAKWTFGSFPYHRKGQPLFVHGNYNARTGCRKEVNLKDGPDSSVTIFKNDPIIVEVIGVNYIIGDADRLGKPIKSEEDIISALNFENEMHSDGKVMIKNIMDRHFTNISSCIDRVRTKIFRFSASKYNPYLQEWDIPMPSGIHLGAFSSQLLLLKIPVSGEYLLKFEARSFSDFESCGIYQIIVTKRNAASGISRSQKNDLKDRYSDIKDRVLSVTTGKIISIHNFKAPSGHAKLSKRK
jgi:hypothetical protein